MTRLPPARLTLCCAIGAMYFAANVHGAEDTLGYKWRLCTPLFLPPELQALGDIAAVNQFTRGTTVIDAKRASMQAQNLIFAEDSVVIRKDDLTITADQATYTRDTQFVTAQGNVLFRDAQKAISGEGARYKLDDNTGSVEHPKYWLINEHFRGEAKSVEFLNQDVAEFTQATVTSCDADQERWLLRSSKLKLDRINNEGTATHARLEIAHVPVFYMPYLSFPISGRKTGFLTPSFSRSDKGGSEFVTPYYLNLVPNRDATITPHYFSKRGLLTQGEFRYLNPTNEGQINADYLPNDDVYGDDRSLLSFDHIGHPSRAWSTEFHSDYASDKEYLDDFSTDLNSASATHLESRADVNYQGDIWQINSRLQYFQTLDETINGVDRPYKRLPQITANSEPVKLGAGFDAQWNSEFVRFDRNGGVVGSRMDLIPQVSYPYRPDAGFLVPTVKFRYTAYDLDNQSPEEDDRPTRGVPVFSLDSGLFFERDVSWGTQRLLQTLEPRLFYLYVPSRQQDDLIVDKSGRSVTFDSGLPDLSFSQLFRDNRFSGVDRVGDANQISYALTTRFLSSSGAELFSASLGQIHYFANRNVVLPGSAPQTETRSDLVGELRSRWNQHLDAQATVLWDNTENRANQGSVKFRYWFDRDRITNLTYRYDRDLTEQLDLSVLWRVLPRWRVVGRLRYSFLDDSVNDNLENLAGFEYESCCWQVRFVKREYISNTQTGAQSETYWVQLELKGLTAVGKDIDTLFEKGVLED